MNLNSKKIFTYMVDELKNYLVKNNLKAMVLGISGGIDSTVCAAICHEVSKQTGIPLIGRSLPTVNNKDSETVTANLVGEGFCDNYDVVGIQGPYQDFLEHIKIQDPEVFEKQTPLANGNIQARLRMIYLYNLASIYGGIVIDTDNKTENNLGYYTLHGDQGDYAPMRDLWKMEVYEIAHWILNNKCDTIQKKTGVERSIALTPTAGLGITSSDLEEIGAESYYEVDAVLKACIYEGEQGIESVKTVFNEDMVQRVVNRHKASEFKRKGLPVFPEISDFDKQ
jgi:NAD+ synthetase